METTSTALCLILQGLIIHVCCNFGHAGVLGSFHNCILVVDTENDHFLGYRWVRTIHQFIDYPFFFFFVLSIPDG